MRGQRVDIWRSIAIVGWHRALYLRIAVVAVVVIRHTSHQTTGSCDHVSACRTSHAMLIAARDIKNVLPFRDPGVDGLSDDVETLPFRCPYPESFTGDCAGDGS